MANKLEPIYQTGVKFYSSLTRDQALGKVAIGKDANGSDIFVEPGAVCFVSDTSGNSIFLNNLLFGDGAIASGTTGGIVGGGDGSGTIIELKLENLQVTTDKTLADYFDEEVFTPEEIVIKNDLKESVVVINSNGVLVNGLYVATSNWTTNLISTEKNNILSKLDDTLDLAKEYADSLVVSLYKVKGSTKNYTSLTLIVDPSIGDVYNVTDTNMNYVYTEFGWDPLGGTVDFTNFYSKEDVDKLYAQFLTEAKTYSDGKASVLSALIDKQAGDLNTHVLAFNAVSNEFNSYKTKVDNNITNLTHIASLLTWQ